jgi:hypothetical protein
MDEHMRYQYQEIELKAGERYLVKLPNNTANSLTELKILETSPKAVRFQLGTMEDIWIFKDELCSKLNIVDKINYQETTHIRTKLEWKETEQNRLTWYEGKELETDGWRLPTRAELVYAYDNQAVGFKPTYYWSSTTYTQDTSLAWSVGFYSGFEYNLGKIHTNYVRLCREIE